MNNKKELIKKLENFLNTIKNCSGKDCIDCNIYETCIEEYSDENLIDMLSKAIEYIKEG